MHDNNKFKKCEIFDKLHSIITKEYLDAYPTFADICEKKLIEYLNDDLKGDDECKKIFNPQVYLDKFFSKKATLDAIKIVEKKNEQHETENKEVINDELKKITILIDEINAAKGSVAKAHGMNKLFSTVTAEFLANYPSFAKNYACQISSV